MKLLKKIRDFISFRNYRKRNNRIESYLKDIRELILNDQQDLTINKSKNPLNKHGKKIFSQSDEDGITIEIIKRINCLNEGIFVELGVGDGTENNTLILKALGWKGFWIGNEKLKIDYANSKDFSYICSFVDLENVIDLLKKGSSSIGENLIDVISLDLDGNDYYFLKKIIENNFRPKLFIVEYNAKFPPPIKWKIEYEKDHKWKGDDYFGASLSTYNDFFEKNGYKLICCNAHTGANAYFIKKEFINLFQDVPDEIDDLYMKPRYLLNNYLRFPISIKTINKFFS